MNTYHREILEASLPAREKEITEYQVNIDNFRMAVKLAEGDPDLVQFVQTLTDNIRSSLIEQKKAQIMHDVIKSQLGDV